MPTALMLTEDALPKYNERDNDEQRIKDIYSYLFMLVEQLRYSLGNLGADNFNETALDDLGEDITSEVKGNVSALSQKFTGLTGTVSELVASGDALLTRIKNAEGKVSEAIQTIDGFRLTVKDVGGTTMLLLTSGSTTLTSTEIRISGAVTFTDLETSGATKINGANITTGTITGRTLAACEIIGADIHGSTVYLYHETNGYDNSRINFMWGGATIGSLAMYTNFGQEGTSNTPVGIRLQSGSFAALKLESGAGMSLEAERLIYMYAPDYVSVVSDGAINLRSYGDIDIHGNGDVVINGGRVIIVDSNGGEWRFSKDGIFVAI